MNPRHNFILMESEFDMLSLASITYNVPAIPVLTCVLSVLNSFARPKSAIFGLRFWSSNILAALMSLCMMCWWQSWCIYARPLAVPMRMSSLFLQLNIRRAFLSSSEFEKNNIYKMRKTIKECIQHKYTVFWMWELSLLKICLSKLWFGRNSYTRILSMASTQ